MISSLVTGASRILSEHVRRQTTAAGPGARILASDRRVLRLKCQGDRQGHPHRMDSVDDPSRPFTRNVSHKSATTVYMQPICK